MPRNKTVTDEELLAVARSLFLKEGAKASTRTLAKLAGVSEAVIFQRFKTKEDLFFAAMVPPPAQLKSMFNVQAGQHSVSENLQEISWQIVAYFREGMPVFLALIAHPAFDMSTFLQHHAMPAAHIEAELVAYLQAEADLGRISASQITIAASVLFAYLHNLVLAETVSARTSPGIEQTISEAIKLLCQGLNPNTDS